MAETELEQADATAWMAFFCLNMLEIALELSFDEAGVINRAYEDMASRFFEHFVQITDAINCFAGKGLWDEADGFYYDRLHEPGGSVHLLRTRSLVGLLPLIAVLPLDRNRLEQLTGFRRRLEWFLRYRSDLAGHIPQRSDGNLLLAIPPRDRLERLLGYLFDEGEFLAPFGIRSLSRYHEAHPFTLHIGGAKHTVAYLPAESDSGLFGGNSNWRGPVWFPTTYLLIESLLRYRHHYGDDLRTPGGLTLPEAVRDLSCRLRRIFEPDADARRPCHGEDFRYRDDPACRELLLFYEYFHPETGRGCGASHQTGWTSLIAEIIRGL